MEIHVLIELIFCSPSPANNMRKLGDLVYTVEGSQVFRGFWVSNKYQRYFYLA